LPNFSSQKCPGHTCLPPEVTKAREPEPIPTCQVWSFLVPLPQSRQPSRHDSESLVMMWQ
jgi:hypothetical protein